MASSDAALLKMIRAIVDGDDAAASRLLAAAPALAAASLREGASRQTSKPFFFDAIMHYVYAGDTALHIAAATYRHALARELVAAGAGVRAKNRRGAEPLHYAVDGGPRAPTWNPRAQAATIAYLIAAGADPNGVDKGGVTPLHRAVRNRCAAAVRALLDGGADARRANNNGSTPIQLAKLTTGRGGTGLPEAKAEQEEIIRLLTRAGV
jgi:hypothetical protein